MVQQICPACGNTIKIGKKFCTSCGTKLSEVDAAKTISGTPPQLQTTNYRLIKGWEVSSDRIDYYQKLMSSNPIGDPIITSKCVLDSTRGFLIVSDNGFAWRLRMGGFTPIWKMGSSKWIRWHDVANIIPKKQGQVVVELKIRKYRSLILDGSGKPKIKRWKLTIRQHKGEDNASFKQRLETFNQIISDIYLRNKVETDPPTSDSRM